MNTLQTSEASILSSIWVFASMINKELIWRVFTPVQQFEAENWLDAIFNDWETLYLMQFKLFKNKYNLIDLYRLKEQIKLIKDFIDDNKIKTKKLNIIPLIVFWGFSTLDTDNNRVRLNFQKINYDKFYDFYNNYDTIIKNFKSDSNLFFDLFNSILQEDSFCLDKFENYIYSPYNNLIEIHKVVWKYWLDWILVFSKSGGTAKYITNIENINNLKNEIKNLDKLEQKLNNETKIPSWIKSV